jgi:hypothetical protein
MSFDVKVFTKKLNADSQLVTRFKKDPKAVLMENGLEVDEAAASDIRAVLEATPAPTRGDSSPYPVPIPV